MSAKYRFSINGTTINPIYKDDLSKVKQVESNQVYFRESLSGGMSLINADFDFLHSSDFETEFILLIEEYVNNQWVKFITQSFYKTDCTWNLDDKKVELKVNEYDDYTKFNAALEKEANLIKLAPALKHVYLQKRMMMQMYVLGESSVSCFFNNSTWEQDSAFTVDTAEDIANYKFSRASTLQKSLITGTGTPEDIKGEFVGEFVFQHQLNFAWTSKNLGSDAILTIPKYILIYTYIGPIPYGIECKFEIKRISDNVVLFRAQFNVYDEHTLFNNEITLNAVAGTDATGQFTIFNYYKEVYMRFLLDVDTFNGQATFNIAADDIVSNNRNYKKVLPYPYTYGDGIVITNETVADSTEFGLADDGTYFVRPYFDSTEKYYPILKSTWGLSSTWFKFIDEYNELDVIGRKPYILKDAFELSSVISKLLASANLDIAHEATTEYSQFLYSDINPISQDSFTLLISQKTNLLNSNYDKPAQKAISSLNSILNLLKAMFSCMHCIIDGKLIIEHISFFKNGMTYGENGISYDYTNYVLAKNKSSWSFYTNKFSYDKEALPESIEFNWMDECTQQFDGMPIEVISKYVSLGNKESVSVTDFTSDVDYMLLNPSAITEDGFVVLAATKANMLADNFDIIQITECTGQNVTSPKIKIRKELSNKQAKLKIEINKIGTFTTNLTNIRFYSNGSQLSTFYSFYHDGPYPEVKELDILVPNMADEFAFFVNSTTGTFNAKVLSFLANDEVEVPFIKQQFDGTEYYSQNGLLSWPNLQSKYHMHNLPAKNVKVNGIDEVAIGIRRNKKQPAKLPNIDINEMAIFITPLGEGQVTKITTNMSSKMNEIELVYDTE